MNSLKCSARGLSILQKMTRATRKARTRARSNRRTGRPNSGAAFSGMAMPAPFGFPDYGRSVSVIDDMDEFFFALKRHTDSECDAVEAVLGNRECQACLLPECQVEFSEHRATSRQYDAP